MDTGIAYDGFDEGQHVNYWELERYYRGQTSRDDDGLIEGASHGIAKQRKCHLIGRTATSVTAGLEPGSVDL